METLTKPPTRTTDRLHQTLAAVARLLDQTMNDIQVLDSEFQERVLKAAMETEASLEQQVAERLRNAADEAERSSRGERDRLMAECQRANQLLEESRAEHNRALALTEEAAALALERQIARATDRVRAEAASRWNAERAHLIAQRDRAFQTLADLDAEHQQERDRLRAEGGHGAASVNRKALDTEIARVGDLIQATSQIIEDPATDLSIVIRKNAERAELESYLRGLRFNVKHTGGA